MRPLEQVRAAAAEVAEQARHVRIDAQRIDAYAAALPVAEARAAQLDPATHYLGDRDATLAYLLVLDAINFGSGYFPKLRKRPGMSGYFTVASGLKQVWDSRGALGAADLAAVTAQQCADWFGQELDDPTVAELMQLFAVALNDLGNYLMKEFEGRPRRLVEAASGSAERLVEILSAMPLYRDVAIYGHGQGQLEVPFYKRAQLTAADLALAGVAGFDDLERLTIFADNLVPHVLRLDGILRYTPELAARIEREELIPAGSPEEIEIRACALHAVEVIAAAMRASGEQVTAMQLDYVLWNRGQGATYKAAPRHRTRSTFY